MKKRNYCNKCGQDLLNNNYGEEYESILTCVCGEMNYVNDYDELIME